MSSNHHEIRVFTSTRQASEFLQNGSAVAIGNYDGIHRGHQMLLKRLVEAAKKQNLKTAVLTFDPHPVKALAPEVAPKLLTTRHQKIELLAHHGVDAVILQKFDAQFAQTSPENFFVKRLLNDLHAKHIVVGYDFTFGEKRSGTSETLELLGKKHQINIEIVPAQMKGELLPSSTLIRRLISAGEVKTTQDLLGRLFYVDGTVVHGHKRGTALGIHTANLSVENEILPADGVYTTQIKWNERFYGSVTNVGFNPTFHNTERSVETHIFDFDGELYGQKLRLFFLEKIREEIHFASTEALVLQIRKDITAAKNILKNQEKPTSLG